MKKFNFKCLINFLANYIIYISVYDIYSSSPRVHALEKSLSGIFFLYAYSLMISLKMSYFLYGLCRVHFENTIKYIYYLYYIYIYMYEYSPIHNLVYTCFDKKYKYIV